MDENTTYQLIVRQTPSTGNELEPLLNRLRNEFGLDSFTARQRLTGQGLALFGRGDLQQTNKIAAVLQKYRFPCWVVPPPRPAFVPDRLRSLDINNESIDFHCRRSKVRLERGGRVVAVLADVSGELNGKLVKRMINQKTYRGHLAGGLLQLEDLLKLIYQGRPVLDVYLLGKDGVRGAVRVLPGKFNHTGLGDRGGLSSIQNLNAVRVLVEEYAGDYKLHTDFGLGHMPDCQIDSITEANRKIRRHAYASHSGGGGVEVTAESRENQSTLGDNLKSLTRYGWLVSSLQGPGLPETGALPGDAGLLGGVASAVAGSPAMGTVSGQGDAATVLPGLDEIAPEVQGAINDDQGEHKPLLAPEADKRDLPAPPDRPDSKVSLSLTAKILGGVIAGLTITFGSGGDELLRLLFRYGMTAGVVPAIASIALFWSGFYLIFLKRQIENTPTSKIRSIAMGMVEVHGRARRVYALVAPISHSACAWYRIRKYRKDSRDHWKLVREEDSAHVPFQIDDGTGMVIVDPSGASVKAKTKHTSYPGQTGLPFTGGDFADNERWVEEIVYEGAAVYVLGYAQPLRVERASLRERTMAKLRQLKLDPRAMRRYDANGDGQIDQTEWDTARSDAEQMTLKEQLSEQGESKRQQDHVVIARPPQRRLPFVVAETESEAQLTTKYGWFSLPLLLGGVVALVFALYTFLQFMRI